MKARTRLSPWFLCVTSFIWAISFTYAETFRFTGITESVLDATLGAPTDGIISSRNFEEGDFVEKDQVIVELRKDLEEWDVKRRKIIMDLAERDLARVKRLIESTGAVSEEELDKSRADFETAQAEYQLARARLKDRQIIAPFSGRIADFLNHEVGEGTKVGNPLVRLVDTSRCVFVCNIPAEYGGYLKMDETFTLILFSERQRIETPGKVVFISPVVDAASGLLKVKILFGNEESAIRPGITGNLVLEVE